MHIESGIEGKTDLHTYTKMPEKTENTAKMLNDVYMGAVEWIEPQPWNI